MTSNFTHPTFLISLPDESHVALFQNLPGAESRLVREKATGLSAEELGVQIAIGLVGSLTYDALKLFVSALRGGFAKLLNGTGDMRPPTVMFSGIKYTISSEDDLNRLVADIRESFDEAFPGQPSSGA